VTTSPLVSSLAKTIGKAMSSTFLPATFTRLGETAGPNDWTPGTTGNVNYPCRAIVDDWEESWTSGQDLNAKSTRKVIILAYTLPLRPRSGDQITIRGETFTITPNGSRPAVMSDPALATWIVSALA
jgi:hypothetical protein